jgi:ectoine hydroxylase
MKLADAQIAKFRQYGFLFVPELLPADEMKVVNTALPRLMEYQRREIVREKDGTTVRSIINSHLFDGMMERLVRHPRLIEPAMQLSDGPVYIFQSIVNFKRPFTGDVWQWHQDYPIYRADDAMASPRGVNVLVFLEDVNEHNGPLMIVPGTHELVTEMPEIDTKTTSYPLRSPKTEWIRDVILKRGIVTPKGKAGSVIFQHLNTLHGSGPNMSPWGRTMLSLTLSSVDNKATGTRRGWVVLHDYSAVQPLEDGCLRALA